MTKNNLAVHLKWLLKQGPSLYPSLIPSERDNQIAHVDHGIAPDQPTRQWNVSGTDLAGSQANIRTTIQNTVRNGTDVNDDEEMARLVLAPHSSSKPRMLSLANDASSRTPKASGGWSVEESPTRERGTQRKNAAKEPQRDMPSSFRETSPPPSMRTPARKLTLKDDIDAIDLTGDFDHTTSSCTAEDFGVPRRLWTEEAASRKEPEERRGKKRKSDEYMADLISPTRPAPKVRSSSKEHRIPSPINSKKRESPASSRKRTERVVADSDDDFNEEYNEDLFNWVDEEDPVLEASEPLYPVLPKESPTEKGEINGSLKRKAHGSASLTSPKKPATPGIQRPLSHSPSHKPLRAEQTVHHHLSPFPSSSSQDKRDPKVAQFLAISVDTLERLSSSLKDTLRKNSEIVYQQAMEGQPAPDLIAENKNLITGIDAIEALQQQRIAYDACTSEKENSKNVLIEVISRGGDPSSMPEELAKSRSFTAEQNQIEAKIRELLLQADILDSVPNSSSVQIPQCGTPGLIPDRLVRNPNSTGDSPPLSPVRTTMNKNASRTDFPPATRSFHTATKEHTFDYDEPMWIEDTDPVTRTMGSPAPPVDNFSEFDMDADDEEMLEVAEHYEDGYPLPVNGPEPLARKVFAETSGNAMRAPSTNKQSTVNSIWHNHPWSKDVRTALRDRFHLRGFRPNQLEAIDATLSGKDTFVLMPTGGGKSLCYQLPSVVTSGSTKGVTIVISPLLSLMQDQVSQLERLKIKALLLNGETAAVERSRILNTLFRRNAHREIELLYTTPEMVNKNQKLIESLEKLNDNRGLARIVIDEAHCVSQWGHDFRPDYKELGGIRDNLPGVPMMALTATATENVKVDVIHNLKMEGCQVFSQSFNRPNLTYEVRPKKKGAALLESIAETISGSYKNQCGIIYCLSRKTCEKVASELKKKHNLKAAHYHAGMEPEAKAKVQRDWQSGKQQVIVATIAFGMGIDKPDVRFVIHQTIPKSLEGYYQETGRAGRDGKRSGCYLYYGYGDTAAIKRMIFGGEGSAEQKHRQHEMLRNVIQYCENKTDCRRVQILGYFNESFRREECNASCDNCKSDATFELRDYSQYAASAVRIVRHFQENLKENVTLLYCVDVFLGPRKKLKSKEHKKVPGYGSGSELGSSESERLFYRLLAEEAFYEQNVVNKRKFAHQYVKLGRWADDFESRRRQMKLQVRVSSDGNEGTSRPMRGPRTRDDHPQSTNVSSPIQSANQHRLARFRYHNASDGSDDGEDSDGFEQIRVAGKPRRERRNKLGPPITHDPTWESIESLHRTVAEDFIYYAEEYCKNLMMNKQLRNQPFPTSVLREIAIHFPNDESQLSAIRGIDSDKVQRYGRQILKLVRDAQRRYEELQKEKEDADGVVPDPNHHNVINLSSDDEYGDDPFKDGASLDSDDNIIPSRYFTSQPPAVYESPDEYQPSPPAADNSTGRKRQSSKRPRRRDTAESRPRAKSSKPRTKPTSRAASRSHKSSKAKPSTARIGMMPV